MSLWLNCLMIFFVRIVDVSLGTVRTVLIIKGRRIIGSIIGLIEVMVWFLVVKNALSTENTSIWIAVAYSTGFALGNYIGSLIEDMLPIGNASIQVITRGIRYDLVEQIRKMGFAVSTVDCKGKDGNNLMLIIEINRKKIDEVKKIVKDNAPDSFVTITDIKQVYNGYV